MRRVRAKRQLKGGSPIKTLNRVSISVAAAVVLVLAGGCTSVTGHKITASNADAEGIRYWLAEPYLFVTGPVELSRTEALHTLGPGCVKPLGECTEPGGGNLEIVKSPDGATEKIAAGPAAVSIVWLPDHCEQYTIQQRSFLASIDAKIELADGWRLTAASAKQDSTQVVGKALDLAGTVVGAVKDVAVAQGKAPAADVKPVTETKALIVKKVTIKYLKPGLYQIFTRTPRSGEDVCTARPVFSVEDFATRAIGQTVETHLWTGAMR